MKCIRNFNLKCLAILACLLVTAPTHADVLQYTGLSTPNGDSAPSESGYVDILSLPTEDGFVFATTATGQVDAYLNTDEGELVLDSSSATDSGFFKAETDISDEPFNAFNGVTRSLATSDGRFVLVANGGNGVLAGSRGVFIYSRALESNILRAVRVENTDGVVDVSGGSGAGSVRHRFLAGFQVEDMAFITPNRLAVVGKDNNGEGAIALVNLEFDIGENDTPSTVVYEVLNPNGNPIIPNGKTLSDPISVASISGNKMIVANNSSNNDDDGLFVFRVNDDATQSEVLVYETYFLNESTNTNNLFDDNGLVIELVKNPADMAVASIEGGDRAFIYLANSAENCITFLEYQTRGNSGSIIGRNAYYYGKSAGDSTIINLGGVNTLLKVDRSSVLYANAPVPPPPPPPPSDSPELSQEASAVAGFEIDEDGELIYFTDTNNLQNSFETNNPNFDPLLPEDNDTNPASFEISGLVNVSALAASPRGQLFASGDSIQNKGISILSRKSELDISVQSLSRDPQAGAIVRFMVTIVNQGPADMPGLVVELNSSSVGARPTLINVSLLQGSENASCKALNDVQFECTFDNPLAIPSVEDAREFRAVAVIQSRGVSTITLQAVARGANSPSQQSASAEVRVGTFDSGALSISAVMYCILGFLLVYRKRNREC